MDDFISCKLNLQNSSDTEHLGSSDSIESKIVQNYFKHLSINQSKVLIKFHCYAKIFNIDMARLADILRPLQIIKKVCIQICNSGNPCGPIYQFS